MVLVQVKGTAVDTYKLMKRHEKVLLEKETMAVIQFHHKEKEWILHALDPLASGEHGKSSRTIILVNKRPIYQARLGLSWSNTMQNLGMMYQHPFFKLFVLILFTTGLLLFIQSYLSASEMILLFPSVLLCTMYYCIGHVNKKYQSIKGTDA